MAFTPMKKHPLFTQFLAASVAAIAFAFTASVANAAFDPEDDEPEEAPVTTPKVDPLADAKKDEKKSADKVLTGTATRVAVLNFGLPKSAQGAAESTVGIEIVAQAWRDAVKLLEKDKVEVVVVRINSGGGALSEMEPFQNVFQNDYKTKFRTVAWIESAISCAAMSPWPIADMYFLPGGNIGACTAWHQVSGGQMVQADADTRESILVQMEKTSRWANRDPKIMRAMQIMEPLSANIDENGNVKFFQDLSGKIILNQQGKILTLTANEALQVGFSKGTAATLDELMKTMGITEYVVAGKQATTFIDDNIKANDKANKDFDNFYRAYQIAVTRAEQLRGDKKRQPDAIGDAKSALRKMNETRKHNRKMPEIKGFPPAWFAQQERLLKDLEK